MGKGRRFQVGVGLIVVGAALVALNVWVLTTVQSIWVPSLRHGGYAVFGVIGATMIICGAMVLLGC